jgi:hypothetical protein
MDQEHLNKSLEIIKENRDNIIHHIIEDLFALKENFYSTHHFVDASSLKKKIDEIYDNYNFEQQYKSVYTSAKSQKDC